MAKRRNDTGQMSKEAYEAQEDNNSDDESRGDVGKQKASTEVLQRRRIVKVSS